ncbi:MAG: hypothetical protein KKG60_03820 [Nanoarchaeota archaeon]|nr:hypothetical protein [Nanoarchaeota archaeon]
MQPPLRTNHWLNERLNQIWKLLYPEVSRPNQVKAIFKGKWKNKFGHIIKRGENTEIAINSLFTHPMVPEYIIDTTLAHELTHYMHGFGSPLKRQHKHPHKGGIVTKELLHRGFGHSIRLEKRFYKTLWPVLYKELTKKTK